MPTAKKEGKKAKAKGGGRSTKPLMEEAPALDDSGKEVRYPELTITEYSTASPHGPITPMMMRALLGWETEPDFLARMAEAEPGSDPEQWTFKEDFHCYNFKGEKVRCWHNSTNRPFGELWCEELIHTILYGQWAGPLTLPGETINGETIRVGRYGRVLSGQHQGTALVLADERLQVDRNSGEESRYPFWDGHEYPVIESIVITGLSEDERILRSIDYVRPRTAADMLYTMDIYRKKNPPLTPNERKEMTRMLSAAIDFLWARTGTQGYKTHPEICAFLERHPKILECVSHLFDVNTAKAANGGRKISNLHLSAGMAAGIAYLMACSGPEPKDHPDATRHREAYIAQSPPSEAGLDWSMWDKAMEFWTRLASGKSFEPVRTALVNLLVSNPTSDKNQGQGGRIGEKLALISNAWEVWKEHPGLNGDDKGVPVFTEADLEPGEILNLQYTNIDDKGRKLPIGDIKLIDIADFGGIDHVPGVNAIPDVSPKAGAEMIEEAPESEDPDEEEIYRRGEQLRAEREQRELEAEAEKKRKREEHMKKLKQDRERRATQPKPKE